MDEWMNGWMDEWMDGWMNDWMNEWMNDNEWIKINEWQWMNQNRWIKINGTKSINQNQWIKMNESKSMNQNKEIIVNGNRRYFMWIGRFLQWMHSYKSVWIHFRGVQYHAMCSESIVTSTSKLGDIRANAGLGRCIDLIIAKYLGKEIRK